MSLVHALLPDPVVLVARLRQLGMADSPIGMATLPRMFNHTLQWEATGEAEMPLNAAVSAHGGNDGSGSLALVMTAYGDGDPLQEDRMQAQLLATPCSLFHAAGLDVPPEVQEALHAQKPATAVEQRCWRWDLDDAHIELDFSDDEEELATVTLSMWRPLPDAEWQGWLRTGGVLATQAAQVRDGSAGLLARIGSLLVANGHPLAARAADMRVFLSMDNDEGGTRTVVQLSSAEGASLWCDENPDGFSVQIVHADGRTERLSDRTTGNA